MKAILNELKESILTGNIQTVGEIYQRLENESIGYPVTGVSKPFLMQLTHKYLMKHFTAEMLNVVSSMTPGELAEYNIVDEIEKMILSIEIYDAANKKP